jgi:hypothetical protein
MLKSMPSLSSLDTSDTKVYAKCQVASCRAESVDIHSKKESLEMPQSGVEDLSFFWQTIFMAHARQAF